LLPALFVFAAIYFTASQIVVETIHLAIRPHFVAGAGSKSSRGRTTPEGG
jgi:hypothetical protein